LKELDVKLEIIGVKNSITGEGPIWNSSENCLYYLDITGKKLHRVDWSTKQTVTKELPQMAGCISITNDGRLIYAMEDGIYNDKFELMHKKEPIPGERFNDGKSAPNGDFYAGTIKRDGGGKFYRLGKNGKLETLLDDVKISNGIDWSIDEKTMYYCDTPTQEIVAYDFDRQSGSISNKRTVITIPEKMGGPDGLCIDIEGYLWIALWGGGMVVRANPHTGELLEYFKLPANDVTCPAFVGEKLDELVITTAAINSDIKKEPFAGCTFCIKTNTKGRQPYKFCG